MNVNWPGRARLGALATLLALILTNTHALAAVDCTLTPLRSTNSVGRIHSLVAHVLADGTNAAGVGVDFTVVAGPNLGTSGTAVTGTDGKVTFNYTGAGGIGTDVIEASGTLGLEEFSCLATQIWLSAAALPTVNCPEDIVVSAGEGCEQSVALAATASGTPRPTLRYFLDATQITSPHVFPVGTNVVTAMASNANGVATCTFLVVVQEAEPPVLTCLDDVFATAGHGEEGAFVEFTTPEVSDCSEVTVTFDPPSGSFFPLGTSEVTCTATDAFGNSSSCTFNVTVEEAAPEVHDLALVRIRAPRVVTLTQLRPAQTKRVVVTIQNRSAHTESINDFEQLAALVSLSVQSLNPDSCSDITPVLLDRPPQRRLPIHLKPRQKLNVFFDVTFNCAVNPARGLANADFRYEAWVDHSAIDGMPDTHPECDVCPRPPLEGGVDPHPNGKIRDPGCGSPAGRGILGGDVLTDVVLR